MPSGPRADDELYSRIVVKKYKKHNVLDSTCPNAKCSYILGKLPRKLLSAGHAEVRKTKSCSK